MTGRDTDSARDLGSLVVPAAGGLVQTGDLWEPYYLSDPDGVPVGPVSEYLRELQAAGRPATTQRSYSLALLRWFRFTWAVGVAVEPGDQSRGPGLLPVAPARRQARADEGGAQDSAGEAPGPRQGSRHRRWRTARRYAGASTRITWRPGPGRSLIRSRWPGRGAGERASQPAGPVPAAEVRPVPAGSPQDGSPADPRQRVQRAVRRARVEPGSGAGRVLGLHRRTGIGAPGRHAVGRRPRPAAHHGDPQGIAGDPGAPGVAGRVRVAAALPQEIHGLVPARADDPLWWTLRRPFRPLAYNAARMMFDRASARSAPGGRCTPCGTGPPTGWPVIPACRSPTCNGYSATPHSRPRKST